MLKEKGLQYTDEGKEVLDSILNRMNSNRLSSSIQNVNVEKDSSILDLRIKNLLEGPSNYENIEGRTFIKSLNRFRSVSKSTSVNLILFFFS